MQPIKNSACYEQMLIVEKYERVISYLYPIAQSMPRKHGVARDMFLQCLMSIPETIVVAGKSNQVSKLYTTDAQLAHLRFWVRFLVSIKCATKHQQETSQVLIAEVGGMLGNWIKHRKAQGQSG